VPGSRRRAGPPAAHGPSQEQGAGAGARVGRGLLAVGRPVGQRGLEALVGDHRADQVGRRPEQGLQEPVGLGAEGGLGQGGQLAQGRRRAVLGLAEQGDPGRGPAGEAPVGVGVGVADHRPQVLDGPLQGGVEGQRRPVVAGSQGDLVAKVEAEPEAGLQLQVGRDPALAR
jgi:hypothetical protein